MLHLAQVHQGLSGNLVLHLLAAQKAEHIWTVITEENFVPLTGAAINLSNTWGEGLLVLVKLSPTGDVIEVQNAASWVLELVQTYLTSGITPDFLQQETQRAEQWRQTLTLQNQELSRRALEVEARREQIQALEESIKRDREGEKEE